MSLLDYYRHCKIAKPAPVEKPKRRGLIARLRARKARKDAKHAERIRELVAARDGWCRYGYDVWPGRRFGACAGPSEWAHFDGWKRFQTRGREPEARHTCEGSLMLCRLHHQHYDAHQLQIIALTNRGCEGPLHYQRGGQ